MCEWAKTLAWSRLHIKEHRPLVCRDARTTTCWRPRQRNDGRTLETPESSSVSSESEDEAENPFIAVAETDARVKGGRSHACEFKVSGSQGYVAHCY